MELVYNFEVADHHTYYVGSPAWGFDVLVHNASFTVGTASEPTLGDPTGTAGLPTVDLPSLGGASGPVPSVSSPPYRSLFDPWSTWSLNNPGGNWEPNSVALVPPAASPSAAPVPDSAAALAVPVSDVLDVLGEGSPVKGLGPTGWVRFGGPTRRQPRPGRSGTTRCIPTPAARPLYEKQDADAWMAPVTLKEVGEYKAYAAAVCVAKLCRTRGRCSVRV